jgi:hypothetical protein
MADLKHVGRLTTNNRKLIVAYRVVPNDPEHCLVVHTESLDAADHDSLINLVESNAGQSENDLANAMARTQLTDGSNMLARFHTTGKLVKVPTNVVEMTPNITTRVNLAELNKIIADQKGVTVADLAVKSTAPAPTETTSQAPIVEDATPVVGEEPLSDEQLAAQYRSQADALFKEAKALREQAEELVPTKKKAKQTADA